MTKIGDPPEGSVRRYLVGIQKKRAVVYNLATVVGITAKTLGVVELDWATVGLFVAVINGSALLFGLLSARGPIRMHPALIHAIWMSADVAIITWMIFLTGGSQSSWFPWYLAPVAAAGYILGRQATMSVMLASFVAYVGLVFSTEGDGAAVAHALTNLLMLFGAAFIAVIGISRLQEKRRTIAQLRELETRRAADLETLAAALSERTRELDAVNERLRHAAVTDPLTGLHNRRFLEERIWEDVAVVRRLWTNERRNLGNDPHNRDLGFLMVDVDNFKRVNDRFGHDCGDDILKQFAEVLRAAVRETDSVVRWGGEEFLLVTRQTNRAFLRQMAERLCDLVRTTPFRLRSGDHVNLACSVGYCAFPLGYPDLFPWDEVVGVADQALLVAKRSGRDTAVGVELEAEELSPKQQLLILRDLPAAVRAGTARLVARAGPDAVVGGGSHDPADDPLADDPLA